MNTKWLLIYLSLLALLLPCCCPAAGLRPCRHGDANANACASGYPDPWTHPFAHADLSGISYPSWRRDPHWRHPGGGAAYTNLPCRRWAF